MKMSGMWFVVVLVILMFRSGLSLCTLEGGLNAIYWPMREEFPVGTEIGELPIEGRSSNESAEISLRLVKGMEWFSLDPEQKKLTLKKYVDRDQGTTKLDAKVECQSLQDAFRVNYSISVNVLDVNDNSPLFSKPDYYLNITECTYHLRDQRTAEWVKPADKLLYPPPFVSNLHTCSTSKIEVDLWNTMEIPVGTLALSGLKAFDADENGPNSQIMYDILDDDLYSDLLVIKDPWVGTITVNKRIDFESVRNFTVTLAAKDSGTPSLQSTARMHVTVHDADDLNPKFDQESYSAAIPVTTTIGTVIKTLPAPVHAEDQDTVNATVVYSLTGLEAEKFSIDRNTGEVKLAGVLEGGKTYLLTLQAKQADRAEREAQASLDVKVVGANMNIPRFAHDVYMGEVVESAPIGTPVVQVSAIDPDGSFLLYSLRDPSKYPEFELNRQTGMLSVKKPLDYERQREYSMGIVATDGAQSAEAKVNISVRDVNDNAPKFEQPVYTFLPSGKSELVGVVKAIDVDKNDSISYHLMNFQQVFSTDDTGAIRIEHPDQVKNMTYELVVLAKDSGIPQMHSQAIVRVDFSNATHPLQYRTAGPTGAEGSMILIISLAAFSLVLLVVCLILLCYLCQRKKKRAQSSTWRTTTTQPSQLGKITAANMHLSGLHHGLSNGGSIHSRMSTSYGDGMYSRDPYVTTGPGSAVHSVAYGSSNDSSPHGSQSPLHPDRSGPSTYRTSPSHPSFGDRERSMSYSSQVYPGVTTSTLANSNLLITDDVAANANTNGAERDWNGVQVHHSHPNSVPTDPYETGMPSDGGTLNRRAPPSSQPLTVYF